MIEGVSDCWVVDESQNDWITWMIMLDSSADGSDESGDDDVHDDDANYSLMKL